METIISYQEFSTMITLFLDMKQSGSGSLKQQAQKIREAWYTFTGEQRHNYVYDVDTKNSIWGEVFLEEYD